MTGRQARVGIAATAAVCIVLALYLAPAGAGPIPGGVGPSVFVTDPITGEAARIRAGSLTVSSAPGPTVGSHFQKFGWITGDGMSAVIGPITGMEKALAISSITVNNPTASRMNAGLIVWAVGRDCSIPAADKRYFEYVWGGQIPAGQAIHATFPEPLVVPPIVMDATQRWCVVIEPGAIPSPTPTWTVVGRFIDGRTVLTGRG